MSNIDTRSRETAHTEFESWLGVRMLEAGAESARIELPYKEENSNPGRQVHGGVVASAMIVAAERAANADAPESANRARGIVTANVAYLASAVGEAIIAEARTLRRGKELRYLRSDAVNAEGKPLGTATIIYRTAPQDDPPPYPFSVDRSRDADGEVLPLGKMLTGAPFISKVGISAVQMKDGVARLNLAPREENLDRDGRVHDGVVAALLDTCGSIAAWSLVTPKRGLRASTVAIDVNYINRAPSVELIARAVTTGARREIFFNRVEIETADGLRIADGTVIYRIVIPD
jgi:uncharacterized protein (TIGR00369 family)